MNEEKKDIGTARWERELRPILKQVKTHGFVAELVRELNRISKPRVWYRQQIDRYLHPDPAKRIEPLAGIGLVLIEAVRRMNERKQKERTKAK